MGLFPELTIWKLPLRNTPFVLNSAALMYTFHDSDVTLGWWTRIKSHQYQSQFLRNIINGSKTCFPLFWSERRWILSMHVPMILHFTLGTHVKYWSSNIWKATLPLVFRKQLTSISTLLLGVWLCYTDTTASSNDRRRMIGVLMSRISSCIYRNKV